MSAFHMQRQIELNIAKTLINGTGAGVDSAKFGNEAHFMSFAAIVAFVASRNGTEGSNSHI
jgi:hypothetical protein